MNRKKIIIFAALIIFAFLIWVIVSRLSPTSLGVPGDNYEKNAQDGPSPTVIEMDYSPRPELEEFEKVLESNRKNVPHIFLSNQLPYRTDTFEMDYYIDKERESIVFTVKLLGNSLLESQQDMQTYLHDLGLTDEQISVLIIEYMQ